MPIENDPFAVLGLLVVAAQQIDNLSGRQTHEQTLREKDAVFTASNFNSADSQITDGARFLVVCRFGSRLGGAYSGVLMPVGWDERRSPAEAGAQTWSEGKLRKDELISCLVHWPVLISSACGAADRVNRNR